MIRRGKKSGFDFLQIEYVKKKAFFVVGSLLYERLLECHRGLIPNSRMLNFSDNSAKESTNRCYSKGHNNTNTEMLFRETTTHAMNERFQIQVIRFLQHNEIVAP